MAKKSKIAKNLKRIATVKLHREKRAELVKILKSVSAPDEDKFTARRELDKLPRDSSATRIRNRCHLTGRPRGVYRKFGLARIALRDRAVMGQLPGVRKASW